ncbi:phage tail protein [Geobacillus thermoleovorans]|uniref:Phage tail protein n=1 Tax=Geobacillus thermoleovorans TaxID=33941 RepID=A0A2Z3N4E8_GEOTH|nr:MULTISPECIES: tail fiber protein [Geobacillus]AWO73872.1 phage tail protein [Geobacillus thermoleovorans]
MKLTGNLGLKKPEGTDVVNIDDLNQNFDILDVEVTKLATASEAGRMSAADKVKLDGIESGAQRNTVTSVNGKTGAVTLTSSDVGASPTGHTHAFAEITSKPTTLSGYGITDAIPASQKGSANGVASLDGSAKVPTPQLPNASTTQAGIVQLEDTLTSTSTTKAATANAVKQVNDTVVAHLADYVKHPAYAVASGSANAYSVTLTPAPTAYVDGMAVTVKINVDSTGASTLNVNGLGAKPLKKANGNDVTNLKANGVYTFRYNASTGNFILQGEGGAGNAQPAHVLSGKTFTNDSGEQTGTMPNRSAENFHMPALETAVWPGDKIFLRPPQGYYDGNSWVTASEPDLIASNIRQGVNIFGVVGTLVEGKKFASGTVTSSPNYGYFRVSNSGALHGYPYITVSGLTFQPTVIHVFVPDGNTDITIFDNRRNYLGSASADITMQNTVYLNNSDDAYVNSSGFRLPVTNPNTLFTWYAYE